MTKVTDVIKIEVEMTANEALRSMFVLGRTNGTGDGAIWKELRKKLDPEMLFNSRLVAPNFDRIDYASVEHSVSKHFFDLYEEHDRNLKKKYIGILQQEIDELQSRVSKIQNEIGE